MSISSEILRGRPMEIGMWTAAGVCAVSTLVDCAVIFLSRNNDYTNTGVALAVAGGVFTYAFGGAAAMTTYNNSQPLDTTDKLT